MTPPAFVAVELNVVIDDDEGVSPHPARGLGEVRTQSLGKVNYWSVVETVAAMSGVTDVGRQGQ
jgi:hypothetical protein